MDPTNVGGGKRATWFNFKNIRVYCESSLCFSTSNIWKFEKERGVVFGMVGTDVFYDGCPSGLAFISYWGIVLFGYDT